MKQKLIKLSETHYVVVDDGGVDNNNMKPISYNNLKVIITKQLLQKKSIL